MNDHLSRLDHARHDEPVARLGLALGLGLRLGLGLGALLATLHSGGARLRVLGLYYLLSRLHLSGLTLIMLFLLHNSLLGKQRWAVNLRHVRTDTLRHALAVLKDRLPVKQGSAHLERVSDERSPRLRHAQGLVDPDGAAIKDVRLSWLNIEGLRLSACHSGSCRVVLNIQVQILYTGSLYANRISLRRAIDAKHGAIPLQIRKLPDQLL